jgi:FkbM family methyltransferase
MKRSIGSMTVIFLVFFVLDYLFFGKIRVSLNSVDKSSKKGFRFLTDSQLQVAGNGHLRFSAPIWVFAKDNITSEKYEIQNSLSDPNNFKAQRGEDIYAIEHFFRDYNKGGIILESGALDGVTYSTSWAFEKVLGWRAVHVEANPLTYTELERNRPDSLNINAALCREPLTLHLVFDENNGAVGGIWEFMADSHKDIFWKNTKIESLPTVMCMPLAPLLQLFDLSHVNLWVLDVEGAELEVLRATDFERVVFDVIAMEIGSDFEKDAEATLFLESKGFSVYDSVGSNKWFVNQHKDTFRHRN